MSEHHDGSCLCGAVSFRVEGLLRGVIYCHCSQCRKQTGHFYAATSADSRAVSVHGEENLNWYAASQDARRGFCKTCGSALFWKHLKSQDISILAGAFENPTGLRGEVHIYVGDKGDYYDIDDGLPQEVGWTASPGQ